MNTPTNMDDIIDSRDVIARIEELESEIETAIEDEGLESYEDKVAVAGGVDDFDKSLEEELATLRELADEASGSPDWTYGEILIRDDHFEDYAQQLAEDCGSINTDSQWPNNCIDWEEAADQLKQDYASVVFDGVDYWIRA